MAFVFVDGYQGESLPIAFESILRSSHLNTTRYIHNAVGSQMILQSSVWSRLGISYLATLNCELYIMKYKKESPVEDIVKAICRSAYLVRGSFPYT